MLDTGWPTTNAGALLSRLEQHYGVVGHPPCDGPFEMILWEIVAYLADDAKRAGAFEALRGEVGLTPAAILAAPRDRLIRITRMGGAVAAVDRAERLRTAARLVQESGGGDLLAFFRSNPNQARGLLRRFPMIGAPGAGKILLFCGLSRIPAFESNGLRVLLRYGFGRDGANYAQSYNSVQPEMRAQLPADSTKLAAAYELLRRHGQELCRRGKPECGRCPVQAECRFSTAAAGGPG